MSLFENEEEWLKLVTKAVNALTVIAETTRANELRLSTRGDYRLYAWQLLTSEQRKEVTEGYRKYVDKQLKPVITNTKEDEDKEGWASSESKFFK